LSHRYEAAAANIDTVNMQLDVLSMFCSYRHRELNQSINEVVRRVPGFQTFAKHSKVN